MHTWPYLWKMELQNLFYAFAFILLLCILFCCLVCIFCLYLHAIHLLVQHIPVGKACNSAYAQDYQEESELWYHGSWYHSGKFHRDEKPPCKVDKLIILSWKLVFWIVICSQICGNISEKTFHILHEHMIIVSVFFYSILWLVMFM